jgi:hypothetical protein
MEIFLGAFTTEWEQRKAAFLHDLTLGRRSQPEEERRRRGGAVPPAPPADNAKISGFQSRAGGRRGLDTVHRRADRPMRARFAGLASGSQPAVVKVASFGGGSRVGAMINYVSRNGAVVVENERGDQLAGRETLSSIGGEWDHLLKNRAESRDIGLFKISVIESGGASGRADDTLFDRAREIVKHGLGDRSFAFAVTARADGSGFDIDGVAVLRNSGGERLTADGKAAAIVQGRMDATESIESAAFRFAGHGNGTDYGTTQVRALVAMHRGSVQDEKGRAMTDAKQAGDLVQLEWRDQLHSRKPRDVMHLILSARAGTDTAAFQNAARDFLGEQFTGHRYVFSMHDAGSDPKAEATGGKRPHVHVHAIIAMRSDAGGRVETSIPAFRQWRLVMAEKARAHGITMEMTDRRDRASAPAYSKNQVRPVNMIGRTRHEGTSAAADRRYEAKRADFPSRAAAARSQAYEHRAHEEWRETKSDMDRGAQHDFIRSQMVRLEEPSVAAERRTMASGETTDSSSQSRTYLVKLAELVFEGDDMRHMTRPEFEAYEKRVETALFQAEKIMPPQERKDFEEIAQAAREHVNVRREIVELIEERSTTKDPDQLSHGPGSNTPHDDKQRWDAVVARHGLAATDEANTVLLDIERTREAIERVTAERPDDVSALRKELGAHISKAAELAISGNAIVREVAEIDQDLKAVLQALERDRPKIVQEKTTTSAHSTEAADAGRGTPHGEQVRTTADNGEDPPQHGAMDTASDIEGGDKTKRDPAKQQVSRLEELQREADERNQRDKGDRQQ